MDKKYSIDEVFNLIGKENLSENYITQNGKHRQSIVVDGYDVYIKSLRYMTFFQKGTTCSCCGRKGIYFKLDGDEDTNRRHFNLYSEDGMLMTKDHIIPKSLGGLDTVSNMQTMCRECNVRKGNGEKQKFNIVSINPDGNIKKYTTLANAVVSMIQNKNKKKPERFAEEVIEKSAMIKEAIENGTLYRNRKWYMATKEKE